MGDITLTDARDELWLLLDQRDDLDPSLLANQTRLNRWLNWAYRRVSLPNVYPHPELQDSQSVTLVDGTNTVTLASTRWAIDHIRYEEKDRLLVRMDKRSLDRLNTDQTGAPAQYARWGNIVYYDKTPGSSEAGDTLTIYTWQIPALLATDAAVTVLRAHWDEIVIEWAASIAWRRLGDVGRADFHRETYAALINDTRAVESLEAFDEGGQWTPENMENYMERA